MSEEGRSLKGERCLHQAYKRHAMYVDQVDESCVVPFNEAIDPSKGRLELANSESPRSSQLNPGSLSEAAVLGFEIGMSWAMPKLLPIWEAQVSRRPSHCSYQFGDFHNTAQSMIDTYVVGAQGALSFKSFE